MTIFTYKWVFCVISVTYSSTGAFVITAGIAIQWVVASVLYVMQGNELPQVPIASGGGIQTAVGTIMLSMAFTYVVPSWINLKVCLLVCVFKEFSQNQSMPRQHCGCRLVSPCSFMF